MTHQGTKQLETDRLILRPFQQGDATAMYNNWASDDAVTKFLTWPTHKDSAITEFVINDWLSHYSEDNFYQWAIVIKSSDEVIGSISTVEINENVQSVEFGYCIGKSFWRKGYTSEALKEIMRFFFEEVGANRVGARHDSNNPNSGLVMKKCGMKYEGTLRQADWNNQGVCDVSYYSLLADER